MSRFRVRATLLGALALPAVAITAGPAVAAPAAPSGVDIIITGGNADAELECGSSVAADEAASRYHVPIQRSHCTSNAQAGDALLHNVKITIGAAVRDAAPGNRLLTDLVRGPAAGVAAASCHDHGGAPGQINICTAQATGGHLRVTDSVLTRVDASGRVSSRAVHDLVLPVDAAVAGDRSAASRVHGGSDGTADAGCRNIRSDALNQEDDCVGQSTGGALVLSRVNVVLTHGDGRAETRNDINVRISGGRARAYIGCFNVTDRSAHVVQLNVCKAVSDGGDAILDHVEIVVGS
jgi:hypothetical protein